MPINVLSVSACMEDHTALTEILSTHESPSCPGSEWRVISSYTLDSAVRVISSHNIAVVLCDHDLGGKSWRTLLDSFSRLASPPCLIVSSPTADKRLWAEALNLGAYDVLAKPLVPAEVLRTVSLAYLRSKQRPRGLPVIKECPAMSAV
jgi:DNA-binding response OmpR family regulator